MRKGKRCPSGYEASSKAIVQAKKKRGLTLTIKDSNDEMNEAGKNETAPKVIPRENWTDESSSEDSESDYEQNVFEMHKII